MNSPRGQLQFSKALMMISVLGGLFLCRAAANISADLEETKSKDRSFIWTKTNADANLISLSDQNDTESLHYYKNGRENLDHQSLSFKNRTRIFPKELPSGNLSLLINPPKFLNESFSASHFFGGLSEMTSCSPLSSVPYHTPTLEVDTETMSAACSIQGGFPAPEIQWLLRHNGSHQSVESRSVHTTMLQNSHSRLFSSHSTLRIPAGAHEAVSCLSHNPILNRTVSATHTFNKGTFNITQNETAALTWRSDSSCCGSSNSSAAAVTHSTVADT
uniref:Ig-like domain-containing protein n=1 Tax=Amphilophus citrinellus TaxID=61819 RepID=A0A3Q0TGM3_AMPCI